MMTMRPALRPPMQSAMRPPLNPIKGGGDIITSIFADGTDGFYFDFSKTDRLFQATTGGALADDAGENIALGLDGSKWGGLSFQAATDAQAEQVGTNPNFASDIAGWGSAGSATVTWDSDGGNGAALVDITGAAGRIADSQVFAFTVGKTYRFRARIKAGTYAGQLALRAAATNLGSAISPTGSYVNYDGFFVAGTTDVAIDISRLTADTGTFYVDSISIKEIPGNHGLQATTSAQPKWQTGGLARFDGTDDNLLTTLAASNTGMTLLAKAKLAATGGNRGVMGVNGADGVSRCFLAFDASGYAAGGVGSDSLSVIKGSVNRSGAYCVLGLTIGASTWTLYEQGAQTNTGAKNGSCNTTLGIPLGGLNANGTFGTFANIDLTYALAIKKALTAAQIAAITNKWGTS